MSILRQIFDGAYYPSEQILPTSQEYREKRAACNEAQKKLREALGTEKKELLDEFLNAYADVQDFMYFEFFREGFALAWNWRRRQRQRREKACRLSRRLGRNSEFRPRGVGSDRMWGRGLEV